MASKLTHLRNRWLIAALFLTFALNSTPSRAGIENLPVGLHNYYIQYLLFVAGINVLPSAHRELLAYFAQSPAGRLVSEEGESIARTLNSILQQNDAEIQYSLMMTSEEYPHTITLISSNGFQFHLTFREYQALLNFSPFLGERLPIVPFPQESGTLVALDVPSSVLYALLKSLSRGTQESLATSVAQSELVQHSHQELARAIRRHVRSHSQLISEQQFVRLFHFLMDLERLVGSNRMLFREDGDFEDSLRTALLQIMEDYRRLLVIADRHSPVVERTDLIQLILKTFRNESPSFVESEQASHFELQRAALAYIKRELRTLVVKWSSRLSRIRTLPPEGILECAQNLELVANLFTTYGDLIDAIDQERLMFICTLSSVCETASHDAYFNDISDLNALVIEYKATAKEKAEMNCENTRENKPIYLSSSTPEINREKEEISAPISSKSCPDIQPSKQRKDDSNKKTKKKGFFTF